MNENGYYINHATDRKWIIILIINLDEPHVGCIIMIAKMFVDMFPHTAVNLWYVSTNKNH